MTDGGASLGGPMSRRLTALILALLVSLAAARAAADTVTVGDQKDLIGLHDVRSLVVDNSGDRVGVTLVHRGSEWRGRVRLELDVSGDSAAEFIAVVRHSRPRANTFTKADGSPWKCAGRTATSWPDSERTVLTAARECLSMAARLEVRAYAISPGHQTDVSESGVVLQQTRPNVVLILLDDMRVDDLAYMPWTQKLIASEGVTFRNSFSPYPLCCPARASILTGRYTHNHGVFHVYEPYGFTSFDDSSTLATWLRRSGYATVYLGKYLNGYGWMPRPNETTGKSIYYVPPGWTEWRASIDWGLPASHPKAGSTYEYFDTTLSDNGEGFDNYAGRYQTRVYGALSERIIRERAASDRPFFLHAAYTAPHDGGPIEPGDPGVQTRSDGTTYTMASPARPDDVKGDFDTRITAAPGAEWLDPDWSDKPSYLPRTIPTAAEKRSMLNLTRQRVEALSVVDKSVKRTIDALAASGELEETLVVFTSDNGFFLGEQRMRHGKIFPHEPSLRVPLLMRGPGIPAGAVRHDPYLSMDFAPTVADLAGVRPATPVDGMSMLDVARHGDRGWKRAVLTQTGSPWWATGIRTDRYLYVRQSNGEEELYDIAADPNQYVNLVDEPAAEHVLSLLRAERERMATCRADECRVAMPAELTTEPAP
jgi:arylsulfatase A-like enzyme